MTEDEDDDWMICETCPDGFCRHWSCNCDCDLNCTRCDVRCPDHDDDDHEFEEPK